MFQIKKIDGNRRVIELLDDWPLHFTFCTSFFIEDNVVHNLLEKERSVRRNILQSCLSK